MSFNFWQRELILHQCLVQIVWIRVGLNTLCLKLTRKEFLGVYQSRELSIRTKVRIQWGEVQVNQGRKSDVLLYHLLPYSQA